MLTDALAQLDPEQQRVLAEALPLLDMLSMSLYQRRRRSRGQGSTVPSGNAEDDEHEPPLDNGPHDSVHDDGAISTSQRRSSPHTAQTYAESPGRSS